MAGFTIHLAVGKRYVDKHKKNITNIDEFFKGILAPDMNKEMTDIAKNKSETHYGEWGHYCTDTNIEKFIKDEKVDLSKDYWKGYFVHLLTDHYFYNIEFKNEQKTVIENKDRMYNDYDLLNKGLIEKYEVNKINGIEYVKKYMNIIKGEPKYLKQNKVIDFIEKISSFDIEEKVKIIKEKGMEGLK